MEGENGIRALAVINVMGGNQRMPFTFHKWQSETLSKK